jgi:hypothetical protein
MSEGGIRRDVNAYEDYGSETLRLRSEVTAKFKTMLDELSGTERAAALEKLVAQEKKRRAAAKRVAEKAKAAEQAIEVEPLPDDEAPHELFPMWQEWADKTMTPEALGGFNEEFARHLGDALRAGEKSEEHVLDEARRRYQHVVYQMYAKANEGYSTEELTQQFETWLNLHWPRIVAVARRHS